MTNTSKVTDINVARMREANELHKRTVKDAARIGELLTQVMENLPHGQGGRGYLETNWEASVATAYRYMDVYKGTKNSHAENFEPKTLKEAAARAPKKPRKPKGALDAASQALEDAGKAPLSREETIALKVKGSLRQTIGDSVDLRDAGNAETVVDAVLNARAEHEAPVARADLTKTEESLLDRAIRQEIAKLRKEAAAELDAEVKRRMVPVLADYNKWADEAKAEKEHYEAAAKLLPDWMNYTDFQSVISCLHPDRAPAGMEEKYRKAFQIMNALKKRFK